MKNYGFTLIELLGVIVILALLIIIVFPSIVNSVKGSSKKTDDLTLELIYNATDMHISNNRGNFKRTNGNTYCIKLSTLINEGYLKSPIKLSDEDITNNKVVQVTYQDGFNYELSDSTSCKDKEIYVNGDIVYFDIAAGTVCTEEKYKSSYDSTKQDYLNSVTGYNGITTTSELQNSCLKFYAFNDDGSDKINLLLDHSTTAGVTWNSNDISANGPKELLTQLANDTGSWVGTETPQNYSVNQSNTESKANYTIDYSTYKARLITAEEIDQITGNTGWDVTSELSEVYYFDSLTTSPSETCTYDSNTSTSYTSGCKYGWLYDRTGTNCKIRGCLNNSDGDIWGYWTVTSNAMYYNSAWAVGGYGDLSTVEVDFDVYYGVRPVIEIKRPEVSK